MGMKKVYSCDICHHVKDPSVLIGLKFSNLTDFKFAMVNSTDGTHICDKCMLQLKREIAIPNDEKR